MEKGNISIQHCVTSDCSEPTDTGFDGRGYVGNIIYNVKIQNHCPDGDFPAKAET